MFGNCKNQIDVCEIQITINKFEIPNLQSKIYNLNARGVKEVCFLKKLEK